MAPPDPPQPRRIAVVINGSNEMAFVQPLNLGLQRLREAGVEVFVANPWRPEGVDDTHYFPATAAGLERLLSGIGSTAQDHLIVYDLGHGRPDCLVLEDTCLSADQFVPQVERLSYRKRTLLMTGCYSGDWATRLLKGPATLFVSAGPPGEVVAAQPNWLTGSILSFDSLFLQEDRSITDQNGDGAVALWERFAEASSYYPNAVFLSSAGYRDAGLGDSPAVRPPFGSEVTAVQTRGELEGQLARLHPGQTAVVFFHQPGSPASRAYLPTFGRMAREDGGEHLFLQVNAGARSAAWVADYRLPGSQQPSVALISGDGRRWGVEDPQNPLASLKVLSGEAATADQIAWLIRRSFYQTGDFTKLSYLVDHASDKFNPSHIRELLTIARDVTDGRKEFICREILSDLLEKNPDLFVPFSRDLVSLGRRREWAYALLAELVKVRPAVADEALFSTLLGRLPKDKGAPAALASVLSARPEFQADRRFRSLLTAGSPVARLRAIRALAIADPGQVEDRDVVALLPLCARSNEAEETLGLVSKKRPDLVWPHRDRVFALLGEGRCAPVARNLYERFPERFTASEFLALARAAVRDLSAAYLVQDLFKEHPELATAETVTAYIEVMAAQGTVSGIEHERLFSGMAGTLYEIVTKNPGVLAADHVNRLFAVVLQSETILIHGRELIHAVIRERPDLVTGAHVSGLVQKISGDDWFASGYEDVLLAIARRRPELFTAEHREKLLR